VPVVNLAHTTTAGMKQRSKEVNTGQLSAIDITEECNVHTKYKEKFKMIKQEGLCQRQQASLIILKRQHALQEG
jgi:hypothetical protein